MSVPVLSEIPLTHDKKKLHKKKGREEAESPIKYDPNSKSVFTEAMRMMCTNLDFMKPEGVDHPVIATTSFAVSAGKTFITANLSTAIALKGKKVLAIDLDLRRGRPLRPEAQDHRPVQLPL